MAEARQFNVHGAEFRVESDFPQVLDELAKDFGEFPSTGVPAMGSGLVKRVKSVEALIPDEAVILHADYASRLYSLKGTKYFIDADMSCLVVITSESERSFCCYARRYSRRIFSTVRNLVKYLVVSLLEDKGVYYLHGAAVCRDSRAAIIFAKSRFGKTRSLLSVMGGGLSLLTDDVVLFDEKTLTIKPFVIRANIDEGHLQAFPDLGKVLKRRGKLKKRWDFWLTDMKKLFKASEKEAEPTVLINILRWNSRESRFEEADKKKILAALLASYREFGSGVYFNSRKTRADVFNFYSNLLDEVRAVNLYAGTSPRLFAQEFEKIVQ